MQEFAEIIGGITGGLVSGWILYLVVTTFRGVRSERVRADLQKRLLDKLESSSEMMEFLESEAGKAFLGSSTVEMGSPYKRILGSVQAGIILVLVGAAFYAVRNQFPEGAQGFTVFGILMGALGLGFVIAAVASYVLARAWGLVNGGPGKVEGSDQHQ